MTREGRAPGPEDTFAPPASTRTEEALPEADHALAPPFVPGRAPVEADEGLAPPFLPGRAPDAREAPEEPVELIETDDDSFPFDTFEAEPEDAAAEPEDAGLDAENQWGPEAWSPFDLYDEDQDQPSAAETAPAVEEAEPESPPESWGTEPVDQAAEPLEEQEDGLATAPWTTDPVETEAEPEPWTVEEPTPEAIPEPADELVGAGEVEPAGELEPAPMAAEAADTVEPAPFVPPRPDQDVAALLERLARLAREEGADGVRREMDSPDRLTSLLAGLVAGYLSGRD